MINKRIDEIERVNPEPDQASGLYTIANKWRKAESGADRERWRKKADSIFEQHPDWMANIPETCGKDKALFIVWQQFCGYLHRDDLEPVLFEQWKANGQSQAEAEAANKKYVELTGREIPITPLYAHITDRAGWEKFFSMGTRYDEKLQRLREKYQNR